MRTPLLRHGFLLFPSNICYLCDSIQNRTPMTKAELAKKISEDTGLEVSASMAAIESFMSSVKASLKSGEVVTLRGFGTFDIKHRASKTAQNISKKISIKIPEKDVPHFKPSKGFTL